MIRQSAKRLLLFVSLVLFLSHGTAYSQSVTVDEVRGWLNANPSYAEAREEVLKVFQNALSKGLPLDPLFDKLKEGAAKRVPPARVVGVMQGDLSRLLTARDILLSRFGKDAGADPSYVQALKMGALALANGIPEEGLRAVWGNAQNVQGALSLLPTIMEMHRIAPLPLLELTSFVGALKQSTLPSTQYGSFVSLYLKAMAGRVSPEETLRLMSDVLNAGGGILQIEREIHRRWRK